MSTNLDWRDNAIVITQEKSKPVNAEGLPWWALCENREGWKAHYEAHQPLTSTDDRPKRREVTE